MELQISQKCLKLKEIFIFLLKTHKCRIAKISELLPSISYAFKKKIKKFIRLPGVLSLEFLRTSDYHPLNPSRFSY